jgi:hypothetical protein
VVPEIKSQPVRVDKRAGLMHLLAKNLPESGMEKVRGGVIALGVAAPIARDGRSRFPQLHDAGDFAKRGDASVDFADFVDVDTPPLTLDLAVVGDLPARLGVEWCLTQNYGHATIGQILFSEDGSADVERVVARERIYRGVRTGIMPRPVRRRDSEGKYPFPRNPLSRGKRVPRDTDLF